VTTQFQLNQFILRDPACKLWFSFLSWNNEQRAGFISNWGKQLQKDFRCLKLFMYVKLFLVCVSSNGLKDSEWDVRTLNFLLQGRSMCGFFPHSVNYSCVYQTSVYLPSFEGWNSVVSVVTRCGLNRDRIPVGARYFALIQTGPWARPASCVMDTRSSSRGWSGWDVVLTTHSHPALRLKKE
jgi:hypothetical protein